MLSSVVVRGKHNYNVIQNQLCPPTEGKSNAQDSSVMG